MKHPANVLVLALCLMTWNGSHRSPEHSQVINSRLGDISFVKKFGHAPDASTDEDLRIRTHLEFVENQLRHTDRSGLTDDLQRRRSEMLDLLHQYWTSNIFPRNYAYPDSRMPCFIDRDGRICAVGYLIEQTAGRAVAERINSRHKYERILDMNDRAVDDWIAWSGLSREECASIQPEYGYSQNYNHITPEYAISSSLIGAANLSLSTISAIQMSQESKKRAVPIVGLVTGAGQAILGFAMMPEETGGVYGYTTNESQKTLSMVNIGLGVTTMILSTWNLLTTPESKEKNVSWNFYSYPTRQGDVGLGFSLIRRF